MFVGSLIGVIALLVLLSVIIVLLCVYIKRSRKRQDTVDRDMEYDDVVEKTTGTTNPIEISMKVNEAYGTHQQENYSAISESSIEACYEELH